MLCITCDPGQRLVAAELEARWNAALQKVRELEKKLQTLLSHPPAATIPSKEILLSLAQDLPAVWNGPATDTRLKQRILRILVREIVVDIDEEKREIVMLLYWAGGCHSELRVKKNAPGEHRDCTNLEVIEVVRGDGGPVQRRANRFHSESFRDANRCGQHLERGTGVLAAAPPPTARL